MITAKHEFEIIPAFTVIAGSSSKHDPEDALRDMLSALDKIGQYEDSDILEELNGLTEEEKEADHCLVMDLLVRCEELFFQVQNIPESCGFAWQDNEYMVLPYIDEYLPKLSEVPFDDELQIDINPDNESIIYIVNCHGNVSCYKWQEYFDRFDAWLLQWSMV